MFDARTTTENSLNSAKSYDSATFGAGPFWWQWYAFDYGFYFYYPQLKRITGADESNAEQRR